MNFYLSRCLGVIALDAYFFEGTQQSRTILDILIGLRQEKVVEEIESRICFDCLACGAEYVRLLVSLT